MTFRSFLLVALSIAILGLGCTKSSSTGSSTKPTWIRINYNGSSVLFEWDYSDLDDFDGFSIYRSQTVATDLINITSELVPTSTFTYEDETVTENNLYFYRVVVVNDGDEVATSNSIGVSVL
jgi:hypothetical protein